MNPRTGGMTEPDWAALRGLDDSELESVLLEYLDAAMAGQSAEGEDALLAALPRALQVLWLLGWLEFEVAQGSLLAYFFNSHNRHAPLAVAALHDIGARQMAAVLQAAAAIVTADQAAWTERRSRAGSGPSGAVTQPYLGLPNADTIGGTMTMRFWEAAETDDWGAKLTVFLREQVDAITAWGQQGHHSRPP
jgi:Domain of unknown function (DUF4375)